MSGTVWPVDAVNGAPEYGGRMLRQTSVAPFLAGATAARPLGAYSGVRPGTPASTVSVTSTTWSLGEFGGAIDGEAAAEAAPYGFAFPAAQSGALVAANASNPQIDILSVQISDPAESDATAKPSIDVVYTAGAPASTPLAPGDTGSSVAAPPRSFVIARISRPKAGGGNPTATWVAPALAAAGGLIQFQTYAAMATVTSLAVGTAAAVIADPNTLNNGMFMWNGTKWAYQGEKTVKISAIPTSSQQTPTAAGEVTWFALGNITVPDWASNADVWLSIGNIYSVTNATVRANTRVGLGTVYGTALLIQNDPGVLGEKFGHVVNDSLTAFPTGTNVAAVLRANYISGSGAYRIDTNSAVSVTFTFQP